MKKYVVGIGASNVDIVGKSFNPLIMKDSNPGAMNVSVGGVTRNVCENIARLGLDVKLISAVGDDVYGKLITAYSTKAGIDMSEIIKIKNTASSTYLAILDDKGDMELAVSDMSIISNFTVPFLQSKLQLVKDCSVVTFDPCLPEEAIRYIADEYSQHVALFCDPVSCAYAKRLKPYIGSVHTLKPNAMELAILADCPTDTVDQIRHACKILIEKGVKRVFVSLGKDGCLYYDNTGICITKKFTEVENMVNASGAGDSFMSAVIYAYVNGFDIVKTLDYALAAGIAAITSEATINPQMSVDMLDNIIKERG